MPKCPKECGKCNPFIFRKTVIPAQVADDTVTPPKIGAYCNALVVYEATGNAYLFSSDGIPTLLSATDYELLANLPSINGVTVVGDLTLEDLGIAQLVEAEAETRAGADTYLQEQIDAITLSSDVVDIVGTYQELEDYDTSHLSENDIIKVLADETVGGATTYYRWVNSSWEYIGEEGPYYTKSQTDALLDEKLDADALDDYYDKDEVDALLDDKADVSALADKQDKLIAGANITIDQATNVISATVPSLDNYYTKSETYSQNEVDSLISGVEAQIPTLTSQLTNDSGFLTSIPIASANDLGGIKVGSGLSIDANGVLSATAPSITVDSTLSTTSTNPVQNKVITAALNNKADISDIPVVPSNVSAFYNDAGYVTSATVAQNYYNKTETYTQNEVDGLISGVEAQIPTKTSDITNDGSDGTSTYVEADELATVATSGSYNDLLNKPTIYDPEDFYWANVKISDTSSTSTAPTFKRVTFSGSDHPHITASGTLTFSADGNWSAGNHGNVVLQTTSFRPSSNQSGAMDLGAPSNTGIWRNLYLSGGIYHGTYLLTLPDKAGTVALLSDLPTVNNATLTIQKNGSTVGTFTANASSNVTANITVPTKTSDLTNDSGFITASDEQQCEDGASISIDNPNNSPVPLSEVSLYGETTQDGTPAPDAPIAVQTVTGNQHINICRKNILDYTTIEQTTRNGVTCSLSSDGTITLDGTCSTNNTVFTFINSSIWLDGDYSISLWVVSGTVSNLTSATKLQLYPGDWSNGLTLQLSATDSTTWATKNGFFFHNGIRVDSGVAFSDYKIRVQVEKGRTKTDWESYQHQSYDVNLGKNLFDKDNANVLTAYIRNGDYEIIDGSGNNDKTIYIPCEPNTTYTISKGLAGTTSKNRFRVGTTSTIPAIDGTVSQCWVGSDGTTTTSYTITTNSSAKYLLAFIYTNDTAQTFEEMLATIQIEKGSQATSYSSYFTPIELCKIDDSQDYIYQSGGDWYIHKEIGSAVYDGSGDESWSVESSNNYYRARIVVSGSVTTAIRKDIRSNHFRFASSGHAVGYGFIYGGEFYCYPEQTITTASAFKTWLASNTTTLYYFLATPTDTKITDSNIVSQLNALKSSTLYAGENNIMLVPAGGANGTLDICFYQSTLPVATSGSLGAVAVGDGLSITDAGVLSVDPPVPTKTSELLNDGEDGTAEYLEDDETAYQTASIPYGQCDNTSTSTVFTATVSGITELRDGVCMWLKNGVVTSAAGFTININNLGAKPVYQNMAAASAETTLFNVNYTMFFVYDSTRVAGGCWVLYRGYNANDDYRAYQVRTNSSTLPMKSATYRYRLLFTSGDGKNFVPATNSTSSNATDSRTVCQDKINPFGSIFYYGTTTTVAANSRPGASSLWQQYAISLGYSFNRTGAALTLTQWKPVYVKAAPQTDGSAIIDSTTPYVQDLPTADDGKIYIFLGVAYSATNIELLYNHPVYYYKDGMIRPYTEQITYSNATTSTAGLMSASDKSKLDGIASGAVSGSLTRANGGTLGTTTIASTTANYMEVTKLTTATDLDTLQTTGIYIVGASGNTNAPTGNWGTIYVDWTIGTKYQLYIPDGDNTTIYKRKYASSAWGEWKVINPPADSSLSTSSTNPIQNQAITTAVNEKANKATFYNNTGSTIYKKVTIVGGSDGSDGVGALIFGRDQVYTLNGMSNSGYMGVLYEIGTNVNGSAININNRHLHLKVVGTTSSTTTTIYVAMDAYCYCNVLSAGTITVADSDSTEYEGATANVSYYYIPRGGSAGDKVKYTSYNIAPTADTTAAWKTALGGDGTYFTWYNTNGRFTNQPSQYGFLRTIIGGNDMRQEWWTQTGGAHYYRTGNGTGWYGTSGNAGAFRNITVNNGTLTIQKNGTNVQTFTANQSSNATANITVPTNLSDLYNDMGFASYSAGDHISISNNVISAVDYVHSENPVTVTGSTPTVTSGMIADGAITASKLAAGVNLTLILSTTDIGEGAALAANTLYGVYQ